MNFKRRIPQYLLGLAVMAAGVVLIKKAELGVSPLSAIPAAVAEITPLTLGTTTIFFHVFCVAMQIATMRKVTLKTLLILPLALCFGYIIDFFMFLFPFENAPLPLRLVICLGGIVFSALGIVIIVGADLMLPAPDALIRQISAQLDRPLSMVKTVGDIVWVCVTVIIELLSSGRIVSVGIGTVASVLLTGRFVGLFKRLMPFLEMQETAAPGKTAPDGEN